MLALPSTENSLVIRNAKRKQKKKRGKNERKMLSLFCTIIAYLRRVFKVGLISPRSKFFQEDPMVIFSPSLSHSHSRRQCVRLRERGYIVTEIGSLFLVLHDALWVTAISGYPTYLLFFALWTFSTFSFFYKHFSRDIRG